MLVLACPSMPGAEVEWDAREGKLSADLRGTRLGDALKTLANHMGWIVFIEPGLESRMVSTRFTNLSLSEALRRILGGVNYALIHLEKTGSSKLMVYATSASSATREIELSDQVVIFYSKRIAHELIVQIKPGSSVSIEEVADALGADIIGKVEGLDAYRLSFNDDADADKARQRLRGAESVRISDNFELGRPGDHQTFRGGNVSGISLKPSVTKGDEVIVGLIDMPVQSDDSTLSEFLLPGINVGGEVLSQETLPSHGTSMAQTVLKGIELGNEGKPESRVRILPVDVYGDSETTTTFQVTSGIYEAVKAGANIINLSLGGTEATPIMEQMIHQASQQGVLVIGAAGNSPGTHPVFPAAYPDVLAVTAEGGDGEAAAYANTGAFVDVMMPGRSFIEYNGTTFMINGTSASAAYVSGLAASLSANTGQSVREVERELRQRLPRP